MMSAPRAPGSKTPSNGTAPGSPNPTCTNGTAPPGKCLDTVGQASRLAPFSTLDYLLIPRSLLFTNCTKCKISDNGGNSFSIFASEFGIDSPSRNKILKADRSHAIDSSETPF